MPRPYNGPAVAPTATPTDAQAARFLNHATFGATNKEIAAFKSRGYEAWLNDQFSKPKPLFLDEIIKQLGPVPEDVYNRPLESILNLFWQRAVTDEAQLQMRMIYALSQIFVVSANEAELANRPHAVAYYVDTLSANAFGNFRMLLEAISLNPGMGRYLTFLGNRGDSGNNPDENYAREIMQLMSIGLVELNIDGTSKLKDGNEIPTYGASDVRGLAKVFTGWTWGDGDRRVVPMKLEPSQHSMDAKDFLGITIPAGTGGKDSLKIALDRIANHPNVGPFIAYRLIQQLVKSNPSPEYVEHVARVFNDDGKGVRGNLRAVVREVLLDPEALAGAKDGDDGGGKLRDPMLRITAWMRAFETTVENGYRVGIEVMSMNNLPIPLRAPSVFNFFKPGYSPSASDLAARRLVAPELQIVDELSLAGYANYMLGIVERGQGPQNDFPHIIPHYDAQMALADDADKLIDHLDVLLTAGTMGKDTRDDLRESINSVPAGDKLKRARIAVFMSLMSPEFLVEQ